MVWKAVNTSMNPQLRIMTLTKPRSSCMATPLLGAARLHRRTGNGQEQRLRASQRGASRAYLMSTPPQLAQAPCADVKCPATQQCKVACMRVVRFGARSEQLVVLLGERADADCLPRECCARRHNVRRLCRGLSVSFASGAEEGIFVCNYNAALCCWMYECCGESGAYWYRGRRVFFTMYRRTRWMMLEHQRSNYWLHVRLSSREFSCMNLTDERLALHCNRRCHCLISMVC